MRVNALIPYTVGAARRMVSACLISRWIINWKRDSVHPELLQRCSRCKTFKVAMLQTLQTYNPTTLQHDTGDTHAAWDMKATATTPR